MATFCGRQLTCSLDARKVWGCGGASRLGVCVKAAASVERVGCSGWLVPPSDPVHAPALVAAD